jgi:hypothetical protein
LILYCLTQANDKLDELRRKSPNAGGLIVATSIAHANQIHQLLTTEFCELADIVTHKEDDALAIIRDFKHAQRKWIISVGMISEGTNIPRLQVCCHLTRVKTELYFRQMLGRILRNQGQTSEHGYLFMPAEPTLIEYAQRIAKDIPEAAIVNLKQAATPDPVVGEKGQPSIKHGNSGEGGELTLSPTTGKSLFSPVKLVSMPISEQTPNEPMGHTPLSSNYMNELNISGRFSRKRLIIDTGLVSNTSP